MWLVTLKPIISEPLLFICNHRQNCLRYYKQNQLLRRWVIHWRNHMGACVNFRRSLMWWWLDGRFHNFTDVCNSGAERKRWWSWNGNNPAGEQGEGKQDVSIWRVMIKTSSLDFFLWRRKLGTGETPNKVCRGRGWLEMCPWLIK